MSCPCCAVAIECDAKVCMACNANIVYGAIPEDVASFIWVSVVILAIFVLETLPRFGIKHPFLGFLLTIGATSALSFWQAKRVYRARVTWKKLRKIPGSAWPMIAGSELEVSSLFNLKLRQGFEFYYRRTYGYFPLWDSQANEYLVMTAKSKWGLWKLFFQKRRNDVLQSATPQRLAQIYIKAIDDASNVED